MSVAFGFSKNGEYSKDLWKQLMISMYTVFCWLMPLLKFLKEGSGRSCGEGNSVSGRSLFFKDNFSLDSKIELVGNFFLQQKSESENL